MSRLRFALIALALAGAAFACAAVVHAGTSAPVPNLYDTGVNDAHVPLADGAVDPHYSLVASPDPANPGPNARAAAPIASGYWVANNAFSRWIAPATNEAYPGGTDHPSGAYTYRLWVDLTGFVPSSVIIGGNWAADNSARIYVNEQDTGQTTSSYSPLLPFSLFGHFGFGLNMIDFVVTNGGGPTGLRVEGLHGSGPTVVGVPSGDNALFLLAAPVPNPARGAARLLFTLPGDGAARLVVRDVRGRLVKVVADRKLAAGPNEASWDGTRDDGSAIGAGVYYVELAFGERRATQRIAWVP